MDTRELQEAYGDPEGLKLWGRGFSKDEAAARAAAKVICGNGDRATGGYVHPNSYTRVKEFHETFGHPVSETPVVPDDGRVMLRLELIREEFCELLEASGFKDAAQEIRAVYLNPDEDYSPDIVGIADALGDLDYVVNGSALEHGIPLPAVTAEIHRSNMTKLGPDGKPIYREDGKVMKGEDYEPPQLEAVLGL